MEPTESGTQSFIIRIWLEEKPEETGQTKWRGHITHVPSGERQYFQDIEAILLFIKPYLAMMGSNLNEH